MHKSAMHNAALFFQTYINDASGKVIVEIGSQNVNGSIRDVAPKSAKYIGLDFVEGNGVDVILNDPYQLPFENETVDVCVCSSVFEHSEMFWLLYIEILRILKPNGLFYLNVPSNGDFHRYPVDCWRFYPDSGRALIKWAERNNYNSIMLESYISNQNEDIWNDFVTVHLKDKKYLHEFNNRILDTKIDFLNAFKNESSELIKHSMHTEDMIKQIGITQIIENKIKLI